MNFDAECRVSWDSVRRGAAPGCLTHGSNTAECSLDSSPVYVTPCTAPLPSKRHNLSHVLYESGHASSADLSKEALSPVRVNWGSWGNPQFYAQRRHRLLAAVHSARPLLKHAQSANKTIKMPAHFPHFLIVLMERKIDGSLRSNEATQTNQDLHRSDKTEGYIRAVPRNIFTSLWELNFQYIIIIIKYYSEHRWIQVNSQMQADHNLLQLRLTFTFVIFRQSPLV